MRLIIRDDAEAASAYVANYVVDRIKHFNPTPAHPFVLGLPTGSSPLGVYKILVQKYKAGEISFENVITFNMDEYVGIPRDHPESYHSFMWKHLFSHVNIHPQNVNILNGQNPNLEAECVAYESKIKAVGGIDLFLAGIGEDGHIAFNEPGSSLASRTRVKTLAYDTILANSRFFGNDVDQVPRLALTVGVQTVLEAREVVAIILGAKKALALQRCIEQGVNHMWTLSSLQLHPHPMIVVDEDATLELQVKTVKVRLFPPYPFPYTQGQLPENSQNPNLVLQIHRKSSPRTRLRTNPPLQNPHRPIPSPDPNHPHRRGRHTHHPPPAAHNLAPAPRLPGDGVPRPLALHLSGHRARLREHGLPHKDPLGAAAARRDARPRHGQDGGADPGGSCCGYGAVDAEPGEAADVNVD
ncbi:hypothetical protein CaCOL14_000193 [Colletotrichum acutatum]